MKKSIEKYLEEQGYINSKKTREIVDLIYGYIEENNLSENEEEKTIAIPIWQLKEIENTLRIASNIHKSPKRETCFDRDVMASWNIVVNALNGNTDLPNHRLTYNQVPELLKD